MRRNAGIILAIFILSVALVSYNEEISEKHIDVLPTWYRLTLEMGYDGFVSNWGDSITEDEFNRLVEAYNELEKSGKTLKSELCILETLPNGKQILVYLEPVINEKAEYTIKKIEFVKLELDDK